MANMVTWRVCITDENGFLAEDIRVEVDADLNDAEKVTDAINEAFQVLS